MGRKTSKKYKAIVKISNDTDGTAYCIKYRFNDLLKFTNYLDQKWSDWKWYNVYSNQAENKGKQIGNFTKFKKPISKSL